MSLRDTQPLCAQTSPRIRKLGLSRSTKLASDILRQCNFPAAVQPLYSTPFFRINQRAGARDRLFKRLQVHAEDSAVLWSLGSIYGFEPADNLALTTPPPFRCGDGWRHRT